MLFRSDIHLVDERGLDVEAPGPYPYRDRTLEPRPERRGDPRPRLVTREPAEVDAGDGDPRENGVAQRDRAGQDERSGGRDGEGEQDGGGSEPASPPRRAVHADEDLGQAPRVARIRASILRS